MLNFIPTTVVLLVVYLWQQSSGHPIQKHNVKLRPDWRKMIGDKVYDYSIKKAAEKRNSSLFEGDIAGVDVDQVDVTSLAQNAVLDKDKLWPGGVVPYRIGNNYFTDDEKSVITSALADLSSKTCLKFIPRTDERNYVIFVNANDGCYSYIGMTGRQQYINLQRGCVTYHGEVQHEVMHALGFNHEQTRMDRDDYIDIIYDNIISGKESNFEKYSGNTFNLPYDYNSIMHYGFNDFAQDESSPTIVPKIEGGNIGNRQTLSETDVQKVNLLYGCGNSGNPAPDDPDQTAQSHPGNRRTQQNPKRMTAFELFFSHFNGGSNFGFILSGQDISNSSRINGTGNNSTTFHKAGCPADSPHKTRNDFCKTDQDCKDSGLGHICCPNCVVKTCTNFCS